MAGRSEAKLLIPHGVIFVYDPSVDVAIPDDTGSGPITFTSSCIAIWTLSEYDGPVRLILSDAERDVDCELVFHGTLESAGEMAFNTSGCDLVISRPLPAGPAPISIYTNDRRYPSKVVCVLK